MARGLSTEAVDLLLEHKKAEVKHARLLKAATTKALGDVSETPKLVLPGIGLVEKRETFDVRDSGKSGNNIYAGVTMGRSTTTLPQLQSVEHLGEDPEASLKHFFLHSFTLKRFAGIFMLREQFFELFFFNAVVSRSKRQLLNTIDVLMNFCLVAMWFEASGKAQVREDHIDWRKVEKCEPQDVWLSLVIGCMFGIVYKVVLNAPMAALRSLLSRDFVYASEWDEQKSRYHMRKWRCKSFIFWVSGFTWVIACSAFLMMFWANIAPDIQRDFSLGSLNYMVQFYFLDSLILAILFGLFTMLAARKPHLVERGIDEFLAENEVEEEEDEGGQESSNMEDFEKTGLENGVVEEAFKSKASEPVALHVGDRVQPLPGKELHDAGGRDFYKDGDVGTVKYVFTDPAGQQRLTLFWERSGLETVVTSNTFLERFTKAKSPLAITGLDGDITTVAEERVVGEELDIRELTALDGPASPRYGHLGRGISTPMLLSRTIGTDEVLNGVEVSVALDQQASACHCSSSWCTV